MLMTYYYSKRKLITYYCSARRFVLVYWRLQLVDKVVNINTYIYSSLPPRIISISMLDLVHR
jgi:hypothetical protein